MRSRALVAALVAVLAIPVVALGYTSPTWNLNGTYTIDLTCTSGCSGDYIHSMTVTTTSATDGSVSGHGYYEANPAYTWDLTGQVSGWGVGFHVLYTGANAGYTVDLAGSIDQSGHMAGTATSSASQAFTWTASGTVGLYTGAGYCDYGTYPGYTQVWTGWVPATGGTVTTPTALATGYSYKLEASGTYFAGGAGAYDIQADAEYSQDAYQRANNLGWTDAVHGYEATETGLLDLEVNGGFVNWGAYDAGHRYAINVAPTGSPLAISANIYDSFPSNNTGGLCVALYADQIPSGQIVSPADGDVYALGSSLPIEANYYDDNPGSAVFWAVRVDENTQCSSIGTNTQWGNVDGNSDPYTWTAISGGKHLLSTADTTGWPSGDYCFVFNPGAGDSVPSGEADVRLISRFAITGAPIANPDGPYLVPINGTVAFDGSGSSDPDGDAITYDWGVSGGTLDDSTATNPTFTAGSTPGVYPVTLQVTDAYGAVSNIATTSVVVYDPSGGFVTGGGWFDSPAGAYVPDGTLAGKATFGFVSKYQKGATVPTGNTEFVFQVAGLNFHSTSNQWLVVNKAGMNAQFKGTGTINGAGDYGFMIWATDGSPDLFRIQITDGDTIVYDNGVQQAIGGGSIVVHAK